MTPNSSNASTAQIEGVQLDTLDPDAIQAGVETLLEPILETGEGGGRVVLLPDAHYPYHPSTGMVTSPVVVSAMLSVLNRRLSTPPTVYIRSHPSLEASRVARYLGYERILDGFDNALVTAAESPATVTVPTEWGECDLPASLADGAVLTVPSARLAAGGGVAGSLSLLTEAVGTQSERREQWTETQIRRAFAAVDPIGSLVDGTHTFTGQPYRARVLFAGTDLPATDRALAGLLGVDWETDAVIGALSGSDEEPATIAGIDTATITAQLPDGTLPASREPHPLVRAGYSVYSRVSGDIYPPQIEETE
jgi:uncharacterized protein (DUF362 family)